MGMPYRVLPPLGLAVAPSGTRYPLVIILHGLGERGTDNISQLAASGNSANGVLALVSGNTPVSQSNPAAGTRNNRTSFPVFLLAPQQPVAEGWGSQFLPPVIEMIDRLDASWPGRIDRERVIIMGISAGGAGVFSIIRAYPNVFSAGVALSPASGDGGDDAFPPVPLWLFNAANDSVTGVGNTDNTASNQKRLLRRIVYTRYNSGSHSATTWSAACQTPALLPWMLAQRRGEAAQGDVYPAISEIRASANTFTALGRVGAGASSTGLALDQVFPLYRTGTITNGTTLVTTANTFDASSTGGLVSVGGLYYGIASYVSATQITLASAAPNQTGINVVYAPPRSPFSPEVAPPVGSHWQSATIGNSQGYVRGLQRIYALSRTQNPLLGGFTFVWDPVTVSRPLSGTAPLLDIATPTSLAGESAATLATPTLAMEGQLASTAVELTWAHTAGYSGRARTGPSLPPTTTLRWAIPALPLRPGFNRVALLARSSDAGTTQRFLELTTTALTAGLISPLSLQVSGYQSLRPPAMTVNLVATVAALDASPAPVQYAWRKIGGPGSVTFSAPQQAGTVAGFSSPGTYRLACAVSRDRIVTQAETWVTVHSSGAAQLAVDVGSATGITDEYGTVYGPDSGGSGGYTSTLNSSNAIGGTTTDGLYRSARLAGGGGVINYSASVPNGNYDLVLNFTEVTAAANLPKFNSIAIKAEGLDIGLIDDLYQTAGRFQAFDYIAPIEIADGQLNVLLQTVSGEARLAGFVLRAASPTSVASPFANWLASRFASAPPGVSRFPSADPDQDGRSTLLEYAEGTDPVQPDSTVTDAVIGSMTLNDTFYTTYTFLRRSGDQGIAYLPEVSEDLFEWASLVTQVGPSQSVSPGLELITYRELVPQGDARFARLRVELNW